MCDYLFILIPTQTAQESTAVEENLKEMAARRGFGADAGGTTRWPGAWDRVRGQLKLHCTAPPISFVVGEIFDSPGGCCFGNLVPNSGTDFETVDYAQDPTIAFFRDFFAKFGDREVILWLAGWEWWNRASFDDQHERHESAEEFLSRLSTFDPKKTLGVGAFGFFKVGDSKMVPGLGR